MSMKYRNIVKSDSNEAISFAVELLQAEETRNIIDYNGAFPEIPELLDQAERVCIDMYINMRYEIESEHFGVIVPVWCILAGMGVAAMYYGEERDKLEKIGLVPALTAERGYSDMSFFVFEKLGIEKNSDEEKKIASVLVRFVDKVMKYAERGEEIDEDIFFEGLKGMYLYGVAVETIKASTKR